MYPYQNPDKAMASVYMGHAMDAAHLSGDYPDAIRLINQAIQLDPTNGIYYHNRGMVDCLMERWRDALSDFSRAISLSPHPTSYEQRGLVNYRVGNREAAWDDWLQALQLDSRRTFALINLAWLCIEARLFPDAVAFCSRAIAIAPTNAKAYENRARAFFEMGDMARGYADLQCCRELIMNGEDTFDRDWVE